ncbi:MAG: hypothetical protein ACLQLG_11060 [Thermoguttaceae bacterium]
MNRHQEVWWEQTRADHEIFTLLRRERAAACHQLHYLQMVTEKLGKAYFWRLGRPPRATHASFVRFLQALGDRRAPNAEDIATLFGFGTSRGLAQWIRSVSHLAHALELLAPALAGVDAPNAEYPWPHAAPVNAPASYSFPVWAELTGTGRGRQLLGVIDAAVREFPRYG